jgi:hypothetical protein
LTSEIKPDASEAEAIGIFNDNYAPKIDDYGKGYGSSIRLVKDNPEKIEKE